VLGCQAKARGLPPSPEQKVSMFVLHLRQLSYYESLSIMTAHFQRWGQMTKDTTGQLSSYAEDKKMKALAFNLYGCLFSLA